MPDTSKITGDAIELARKAAPGTKQLRKIMPDTSKITDNAIEVARKAAPGTEQLKSPAAIATAGAALIALPFAAQKITELTGGKAAKVGQRAKSKVTEKAKEAAGDLADDTIKEKMPKGLGDWLKVAA